MNLLGFKNRKALCAMFLFLAALVLEQPAYSATLIDNFNNGGADDFLTAGATAWRRPNQGMGGERETECHADVNNAGANPVTCGMATLGTLLIGITDDGDSAYFNVIWDGDDNLDNTYQNDLGLGGVDFTAGGNQNAVRLDFSSNNPFETGSIELCAYTTLADYSCKVIGQVPDTVGGAGFANYMPWDFIFSDFSDTVGGTGADFTNVNAFELRMNAQDAIILGVDRLFLQNELFTYVNYELITDNNGDGDVDVNDVVEYTVDITNFDDLSDRNVTNLTYSANIDANATLIPGSVSVNIGGVPSNETVTTGNDPSDTSVAVNVGTLPDAITATITYQVQIDPAVADGTSYSHVGSLLADNGISTTTTQTNTSLSKDTFTINTFDFVNIMMAEANPADDADADGFPGPGERVRFTASVTNNAAVGRTFYFWQYGIDNANLNTNTSHSPNLGIVNISGQCTGCLKVNKSTSLAPGATQSITFNAVINSPFPFASFGATPAFVEAQSIVTDRSAGAAADDYTLSRFFELSDDDVANEMDYTRIQVDAFPNNADASVDNDNDGLPDEWNASCDATCQSNSTLTLDLYPNDTNNNGTPNESDPDIDGDGVANGSDAFPYIFAASIDTDGDGMPDSWTAGCDATCQINSGLTLDDDRDGDGVNNDTDPFPDDGSVSVDTDGDGMADDWDDGCDAACQSASSHVLDTDDDNDGVLDVNDDFPLDLSVALDTDGDGLADDWVATCDATCQGASAQMLDDDDDGDGDLDVNDAYPLNKYASLDDDFDGMPDAWNAGSGCDELAPPLSITGCEYLSGLTLDPYPNDTDNDGENNDVDTDIDGDGLLNADDADDYVDTNPPVVTAPVDITVTATGTLTSASLGSATAVDFLDGNLTATADDTGPFTVGVHVITWSATDAAGNTGTDTQQVTIQEAPAGGGGGGGGGGSLGLLTLLSLMIFLLVRKRDFSGT